MRFLLFALGLAMAAACGGPQLDRLEADPAATHRFTRPLAARTHPAVDGAQRFVAAAQRGDVEGQWQQLSNETRRALQQRGQGAGVRGVEVLRSRKLPVSESMAGAIAFDPLVLFAVPGVQTLQLVPGGDPGVKAVEQRISMVGAGGRARVVTMRFEGYFWRLHHPELTLPEPASQP